VRELVAEQPRRASVDPLTSRVWAKRVVAAHQTIAVEDFRPRFLARSRLARTAADAAIAAAKRELIERGTRAGRKVVLVPPAYTTMTCSECLAKAKQRLGLAERVFRCEHCGYTADRDRNAARTILATVDPDRVGVDDVRHCLPPPEDVSSAVRVRNPPASAVGKG
jgi:putative transposase